MKTRLILFLPLLFLAFKSDVIKIEDVYEDPANLLLKSDVIELPGKSTAELKEMVDNWANSYFANAKENWADREENSTKFSCLIPFEMESIIGGGLITAHYYIVMMVEFKDGKVRYKLYDDGNEYEPETENTSAYPAHSYYYKDWFDKNGEIENKGFFRKARFIAVNAFNQKIIDLTTNFKAVMLGEEDNSDDDW